MLLMKDLISKNLVELEKISKNLKEQLFVIRFQKATGQNVETHKQKEIRRDIARVLTAINLTKSDMSDEEIRKAKKTLVDEIRKSRAKTKDNSVNKSDKVSSDDKIIKDIEKEIKMDVKENSPEKKPILDIEANVTPVSNDSNKNDELKNESNHNLAKEGNDGKTE